MQRTTRLLPLALACAPAFAQPTPAPTPMATPRATWSLTPGVTGTPTQRRDNPGAASNDRMYVFGGRSGNATTTTLNALYEFNGTAWTLMTAEGAVGSPPARGGACVAWDNARGKLMVFGGDTGGATPVLLGDTWEWDSTNGWVNVNPPTTPSARRFAAMAYDPGTGGMLLFGGETAISTPATPPSNETWIFLAGTWTLFNPASSPPARRLHSLVTRADCGDVFLCAGDDASVTPNVRHLDAWRFTANNWVLITPITNVIPHGTTGNHAVYDQARRRVVLQGGQGISVPNTAGGGGYGNDYGGSPSTWCSEFDSVSNEWLLYGAAAFGTADPVIGRISRYFGAYIPALGKVYKVSGQNPSGTGTITATCEYQANPVAAAPVLGNGCNGLTLSPTGKDNRPWVGRNFTTTASGLTPVSIVLVLYGINSIPTPLSALHPAGVVGCDLLSTFDIMLTVTNTTGAVATTIPVPNNPRLVLARLYHQALQVQFNGAGITAITSTNGLSLGFGVP